MAEDDAEERDLARVREIIEEARSRTARSWPSGSSRSSPTTTSRCASEASGTVKTNLCRAVRHVRLKLRNG